jgi:hypothetical protein
MHTLSPRISSSLLNPSMKLILNLPSTRVEITYRSSRPCCLISASLLQLAT